MRICIAIKSVLNLFDPLHLYSILFSGLVLASTPLDESRVVLFWVYLAVCQLFMLRQSFAESKESTLVVLPKWLFFKGKEDGVLDLE